MLFDNRRFNNTLQQYKTLNSAAGGLLPLPQKNADVLKQHSNRKHRVF